MYTFGPQRWKSYAQRQSLSGVWLTSHHIISFDICFDPKSTPSNKSVYKCYDSINHKMYAFGHVTSAEEVRQSLESPCHFFFFFFGRISL